MELSAATEAEVQEMEERRINNRIECLDGEVRRLEKKNKQKKAIAEQVLEALLGVVVENEDHYSQKGGFTYGEWQVVQKQFIAYNQAPPKARKATPIASQHQQGAI